MVIELVELRIRPELTDESFLEAAEVASSLLRELRGFCARRLAKAADGLWIDYVEWESMELALEAARRFNSDPRASVFNSMIAPGSVTMRHFTVAHTADRLAEQPQR
jgi:hypothetical protein